MLSYCWYFPFTKLEHIGYACPLPTFFPYVQKPKTSDCCIFIFAKIFFNKAKRESQVNYVLTVHSPCL